MRLLLHILLITSIASAVSCSRSASRDADSTAKDLNDIEQRLAKAWVDGDRNTISAFLAPDWSVIDVGGRFLTKEQVFQEAFAEERKIGALTIDDVKVRSFGDTAVVTGRTTLGGGDRETDSSVVFRFTDVFARRNGGWQVVASQGTAVAQ
jgi:ketosteroid isomerase-like protein